MTALTTVRCTLDDFIANNKQEVKLDGPDGLPYDLRILVGRGFQLESTNTPEGTDLSKDISIARLLNKDGTWTGYTFIAYGSRDVNTETGQTGPWDGGYCLYHE